MNRPTKRVEIERKDSVVILKIDCIDHYEAMLLYEECTEELFDGSLHLSLNGAVAVTPKEI